MATEFLLGECPRCGGDLEKTRDVYGSFYQCLQCGYLKDLPDASPRSVAHAPNREGNLPRRYGNSRKNR